MTIGEFVSWVCTDIHDKQLDWNSEVVAKLYDWHLKKWRDDITFTNPMAKEGQLWLLCLDDATKYGPDPIVFVMSEIARKSDSYWKEYKGQKGASRPEMRGSDYVQGLVDGLDEALEVMQAVFGPVDMERRKDDQDC